MLTVLAAVITWFGVNLIYLLVAPGHDWRAQAAASRGIAAVCTILMGYLTWRLTGSPRPGLLKHALIGAFVTGSVGFVAGFVGPIIFEPDANQGPLVGIFFTGPLGFLAGGIGGVIYTFARRKPNPDDFPAGKSED